ncbi:hypothetical protein KIN20_008777 [Parelaphostrongylus tenuis]|uniref:Uncharacterized protein n=1 Tax=Parelaphostrongylus tenuis TaxID=148309 RepID=A0AAD5MPJ2_PARTN|nr:hypothetical protein KIN20_008777 [Parelaphostrongylus tenuis]
MANAASFSKFRETRSCEDVTADQDERARERGEITPAKHGNAGRAASPSLHL